MASRKLPKGIDRLTSGMYRARFMHDGTRYSTDTYTTLTDTKDALAALRADVTRGEWVASKGGVTLGEWFDRWNPTRQVQPTTRHEDKQRFDRHIRPVLGSKPLRSLTPDVLAAYQARLDLKDATKRRVWNVLSASLGHRGALRAGLIRANPCSAVAAPQPPRPAFTALTPTQVRALLDAIDEHYRVFLLAAALTGLRWSELVGLAVEDWHQDQGYLHVQRAVTERAGKHVTKTTKSNAERIVPVHPDLASALKEHVGPRTVGPLFLTGMGTPLRHGNFRRDIWLPAQTKAGVVCRWHDLRHTAATHLLEAGADVTVVQDILGHASLATTRIYVHTTDARKQAAVNALHGYSTPIVEEFSDEPPGL